MLELTKYGATRLATEDEMKMVDKTPKNANSMRLILGFLLFLGVGGMVLSSHGKTSRFEKSERITQVRQDNPIPRTVNVTIPFTYKDQTVLSFRNCFGVPLTTDLVITPSSCRNGFAVSGGWISVDGEEAEVTFVHRPSSSFVIWRLSRPLPAMGSAVVPLVPFDMPFAVNLSSTIPGMMTGLTQTRAGTRNGYFVQLGSLSGYKNSLPVYHNGQLLGWASGYVSAYKVVRIGFFGGRTRFAANIHNIVNIPWAPCDGDWVLNLYRRRRLGNVPGQSNSSGQVWHSVPISPASRMEDCTIGRSGEMWGIRASTRQVMGTAGFFGSNTAWDEVIEKQVGGVEFSRIAVQSPGCRVAVVDTNGGLWTGDSSKLNLTSVTLHQVAMSAGYAFTSIALTKGFLLAVTTSGDVVTTLEFPYGTGFFRRSNGYEQVSASGEYFAGIKTLGTIVRGKITATANLHKGETVVNPAPGRVKDVSIGADGDVLAIANDAEGVLSELYWLPRGEATWMVVALPNVHGLPAKVDMDSQNRVCLTTDSGKLYSGALSRSTLQGNDQMMWVRSNGSSCPVTCSSVRLSAVSVDYLNVEIGVSTPSSYVCAASQARHTSSADFVGWNKNDTSGCVVPGVSLTTIFTADVDFDCLCRNQRETEVKWAEMNHDCRDCEDACHKVNLGAVQTKREFLDIGAINVCAARDSAGVIRPGYNFHMTSGCYVSPMRTIDFVCICFTPMSMFPTGTPTRTPTGRPSGSPTEQPSKGPSGTPTSMPTNTCHKCCMDVCPNVGQSAPAAPPAEQEKDRAQ